jgi:hypothetical protein
MTPILTRCIESICSERDSGWDITFDVVDQLVKDYGEERLANRVVEEVPRTVPFEVVSGLLSILIWSTSDNGGSITDSANLWLREQTDTRKVLIALNLEVIPFSSEGEAKQVLVPLMKSNYLVHSHCVRILDFFEKQQSKA